MEISSKVPYNGKKSIVIFLTVTYFLIGAAEVSAEYFMNTAAVYIIKPLLLPVLLMLYLRSSQRHEYLYIGAITFSWIANYFFISDTDTSIFTGAMFYFVFRIASIALVIRLTRFPSAFPTVVGSIPFLFVFMFLIYQTYEQMGSWIYIFSLQCLLMTLLGGISVGNYILRSNKANSFLLGSTLLFAATQFIFAVELFYEKSSFFQSIAMVLFIFAQYMFYRFVILAGKSKRR